MTQSTPARLPIDGRPIRPAATFAAVAAALLALSGFDARSKPAHAQDDATPRRLAPPREAAARAQFLREIHRSLKSLDERLIALAKPALDVPNRGGRLRDRLSNLQIEVRSAEANYLNAKLAREVAEIAVTEYREGVFVQDQAKVEADIRRAERDLGRAGDMADFADMVAARDGVKIEAHLRGEGRAWQVEAARLRKKALLEHTAPRTIKEIEAEVQKARSNENAVRAEWERLRRQEQRLGKAIAGSRTYPVVERRSLDLLTRASTVEEQLVARLEQLSRRADSDEVSRKEIRELANQLGAIVEDAEAARAAEDFADLKPWVRDAARRRAAAGSK